MARRSVQGLASQGQTPKKVFSYNKDDPSSYVPSATPTRMENYQNNELKSSLSYRGSALVDDLRPKTSRGTAHPTPDAFTDYVVPSPLRDAMMENMHKSAVIDVHNTDESNALVTHALSEKDVYIGCWLFGALLRV